MIERRTRIEAHASRRPHRVRRPPAKAAARDIGAAVLAVAALLVSAALLLAGPVRAADEGTPLGLSRAPGNEADQQWKFRVFVDDKEVGHHHFRLDELDGQRAGERVLESVADFEYKLLFVTLYRYEHENREVWNGDCLTSIESETDANGKDYAVEGELRDDAFVVDGTTGVQELPECVMSFAYWNPDFLEEPKLLNTQNGEYLDVTVSGPERDERFADGETRPAWRYRLEAKKLDLRLWYSDEREWLGLETTYENGRTLRYELVTEPQVAAGDAAGRLPGLTAGAVASEDASGSVSGVAPRAAAETESGGATKIAANSEAEAASHIGSRSETEPGSS